jgi:hypothetical protein
LQSTSASLDGKLRDAVELVSASGQTANSGFVNVTAYIESLGFVSIGGVASGRYDSFESHHWQIACDYSDSLGLGESLITNLTKDYCCNGLFQENKSYDSYDEATGRGYRKTSEDLGGYFSDAWKIEFCNETIEGSKLVEEACKIALKETAFRSQCYAYDDKGQATYDDKGNHLIDAKKIAKNCTYNTGDFGATVPEIRKIGPKGECPCSIIGGSSSDEK